MARKRMISPEIFTSPTVAGWPIPTRWTWAGMLCYLDDYGYGADSSQLVKASVWPLDDAQSSKRVAADVDRIVASGSLCRFSCCGREQMHAPAWTEWQTVQHPGKPRFCPCPVHAREAHEIHLKDSRGSTEGLNPNVVKENLIEGSSSDDCPHDSQLGLCKICLRGLKAVS